MSKLTWDQVMEEIKAPKGRFIFGVYHLHEGFPYTVFDNNTNTEHIIHSKKAAVGKVKQILYSENIKPRLCQFRGKRSK